MKLRKLFAGLAAAVTLFGGMTIGAATANAADGDTATGDENATAITFGHTITMHSDNYNQFKKSNGSLRDFAYVKIADYVSDGNTGVTLKTIDDKNGTIVNALKGLGYTDTSKDPLVWLSEQGRDDNSLYRKFVDAVDSSLRPAQSNFNSLVIKNSDDTAARPAAPSAVLDEYMNTVTFDFGTDKGLYLIFDLSGDQEFPTAGGSTTTVHQGKTVMVGTSIEGAVPQPDNADGKIEAKGDETPNSQFEFTKKNRDGDTLSGAEFEVRYDSGDHKGELVKFQKTDVFYKAVDFDTTGEYTTTVVSDQNGAIHITGLQPGWYVITETKAPEGYSNQYLPSFKIMVNNQGIVSSYIGKDDGDPYDLVVNQNGLTVVNLRPTELPKTGAEGIALFIAVAALLLGTAGTVYLKSRGTKRALRG